MSDLYREDTQDLSPLDLYYHGRLMQMVDFVASFTAISAMAQKFEIRSNAIRSRLIVFTSST